MLAIGILLGITFGIAPIKSLKWKTLVLVAFASIAGVGLAIPAWYYSASLTHIYFFDDFSYGLLSLPAFNTLGSDAPFIVAVVLVVILEACLASGFIGAVKFDQCNSKRKQNSAIEKENSKPATSLNQQPVNGIQTNGATALVSTLSKDAAGFVDEQGLRKDEQSMMELFLYGKVTEIVPVVDASKPEGYVFEGVPQLDWETKRSRQALDSLVRKGFLKAELLDKVIVCMACGSANVRIKKLCPECMSMRLRKEALIEHFSCGAVDRQAAFETENGDFVCPKCKVKLQLIGSDYRVLPPAYLCLACNVRSSDPLLVVKCEDCGSTAQLDEEPEVYLYKYTVNPELPMQEMQQIKPIEVCTNFFKSLGYTFVAPAFVSGKSGTQHLFDILILGRVGWVEPQSTTVTDSASRKDNGNTVIEVLISSKPIDLKEMTRIYGMTNDIECDSLIFVIPGMTKNARNYAAAYNMKVSEGKTIEEALANSKIPKAGGAKL
jgi:Zn finger protein HypA/HybF involved in hydrogenase expression